MPEIPRLFNRGVKGERPLKFKSALLRQVHHTVLVFALFGTLLSFTAAPEQAVASTPTCAQGGPCSLGDIGPGGGRVFYVAPDDGTFTQEGATDSMCSTDCKYLEAAPTTGENAWTDASYVWSGNTNSGVGTTGTAIGTGYRNTVNIVAQSNTADKAGTKSLAFRGPNSLSDWHLPSRDELNQLYLQRVTVSASAGTAFVNSSYVSSSESSANNMHFQNFFTGEQSIGVKSYGHRVRPIRAFGLGRAPTKVAITRAPVRTLTTNTVFASQPQITIQDVNSRTVKSSAVVTATISAGGTLLGTTTATASDGVATFSNLGVNGTLGSTYTITYTAVGLTVATATVTLTGTTCDGSTFTCQVGDIGPGGGLVFYVNTNGFRCGPTLSSVCRYLEAAREGWFDGGEDPRRSWATDTDPGAGRGNQEMIVIGAGATGTVIGTGYQNSVAIVNHGGNLPGSSAAALARSYTGPNNLTDWYLPSKNELREITSKQNLLAATAGYWSSSEISATKAWDEGNNYNQGQANKWSTTPVRPIRAYGTLTAISSAAIAGVTAPVTGATPVTAVTPGTGYTGTVSWSTSPSTFAPATTYTATITLTATAGYSLAGVNANFFTVSGATSVTHAADSGVISAVFPATAKLAQTTLSITSLTASSKAFPYTQALSISTSGGLGTGATTFAIATGGSASGCALSDSTSTSTITATTIGTCLIQASKAADSTYDTTTSTAATFSFTKAPQTITFATPSAMTVGGSTQTVAPTASSSLTVTLTSTTTGICTIAGFVITVVTPGTCSITASQAGNANYEAAAEIIRSFSITGVVSIAAIAGVTAPVTGATPVSTTTAGAGYTGTVSWSDSPTIFAPEITYTATITLTVATGYTLTGVSSNFFTVAGATTVTHNANSGVVTAIFPATATPTSPSSAMPTQTTATSKEDAAYASAQAAIVDTYRNALIENRAKWRLELTKSKANYDAEVVRIKKMGASRTKSALITAALKTYITTQRKITADYKTSNLAAVKARDLASKAALDAALPNG